MKSTGIRPLLSLASESVALACDERARRIAAGEENHIDIETWLLPRWEAWVANGDAWEARMLLCEAVGYVGSQRVAFRPSNPAFAHMTSPNCARAEDLLSRILASLIGRIHEDAQRVLTAGHPETQPIAEVFEPTASCFSAYTWEPWNEIAICYRYSSAYQFVKYALVLTADWANYGARYSRVAAPLRSGPAG